jgi:cupin 2 domain-containing protein|tara:strand:+ start:3649 stop:4050 length:402 start_codon:yes stop_codon:yes gene_type:complete
MLRAIHPTGTEGFTLPDATLANLFANLPDATNGEVFDEILRSPCLRIERIVSHGQSSPETGWYDQQPAEWVILLTGSAEILFEGEDKGRVLKPGDHLYIPPQCRHRVVWTEKNAETVWLAVFFDGRGVHYTTT